MGAAVGGVLLHPAHPHADPVAAGGPGGPRGGAALPGAARRGRQCPTTPPRGSPRGPRSPERRLLDGRSAPWPWSTSRSAWSPSRWSRWRWAAGAPTRRGTASRPARSGSPPSPLPLLTRLGRHARRAGACGGLVLLGLGLLLVVPAPSVAWSLAPLALVGAASVAVEASATGVLQDELPDSVRATVLGLNDTVIISAALAGSLLAPVAIAHVGGALVLTRHRGARAPRRAGGCGRGAAAHPPASVVLTEREDDHAQPATPWRPRPLGDLPRSAWSWWPSHSC